MRLTVIFIYLALVLLIGFLSHRLFRRTGEDYFVASRGIGSFVLLMTLFGSNMTAFAILGASGESYRIGIGVFGLMASSSALIIPAIFFFIGTKLWALGKKYGYMTQVQFFRDRYDSSGLGLLLFGVLVLLLAPYLLIGVMGAGITFDQITDGAIPGWLGSLLICLVVFAYVTYSGIRGASWVNTFQTTVFMILGSIAAFVILDKHGGLGNLMANLQAERPDLLIRGEAVPPLKLLTYTFIPLSAGMFPHIFAHWLTAKRASSFKIPIVGYPLCMIIVWVPSVLLGVLGVLDFPDLAGPEANSVLIKLVDKHATGFLSGLLAAGVFAAIMSSLDSQTLSLGNMFTQDVVRHYGIGGELGEDKQVWWGRLFVFIILAITFTISLVAPPSIFQLGVWSFTGFSALFPLVIAAVYWRRSTKAGAFACILTVIIGWTAFFIQGKPMISDSGVMAVAVLFFASSAMLVIVSLLTQPPKPETLQKFFPEAS